jgi:hypothetical protein
MRIYEDEFYHIRAISIEVKNIWIKISDLVPETRIKYMVEFRLNKGIKTSSGYYGQDVELSLKDRPENELNHIDNVDNNIIKTMFILPWFAIPLTEDMTEQDLENAILKGMADRIISGVI